MPSRRITVATGTIGALLLLTGLAPNRAIAAVGESAAHPCLPAILALPLPVGDTNGDVLAAAVHEVVGYVADDAQHQHAAVWFRSGATWTVRDLGDLGVSETSSGLSSTGVNEHGLVTIGVNTNVMGAWVYERGAIHQLRDFSGGSNAYARAVNNGGEIVGEALTAQGNDFAAVWRRWWSSPIELRPAPGYDGSFAQGVDARGDVVGGSFSNAALPTVATRWSASGRPVTLVGLGAGSQAFGVARGQLSVGVADTATGPHAVVWEHSRPVDLGLFPGSQFSRAVGVTPDGMVVGFEGANPPPPAIPVRHVLFWPGTGPVRTLLPLSLSWADGAYSHAADNQGDVFGASARTATAYPRPTEWTCARQQSFVPPAVGTNPAPHVVPQRLGRSDQLHTSTAGRTVGP